MSLPHEASTELFRGRHFNYEIITLCDVLVTYKLSYRDLNDGGAQRGRGPYDYQALGATLCTGVQKAVATLCSIS